MSTDKTLGATYLGQDKIRFLVWAPFSERLDVHIVEPREWTLPLDKNEWGYFETVAEGIPVGSLYFFLLSHVSGHFL